MTSLYDGRIQTLSPNTRRRKERLFSSWPAQAGHDGWSSRWVNLFDGWYKCNRGLNTGSGEECEWHPRCRNRRLFTRGPAYS